MTKISNIVEFRPNRGRIETPLSVSDFRNRTKNFLSAILETQEPLQDICNLFKQHETIWPDQREYIIDLLQSINEPVQEFCSLLDSSTRLPDTAIALRYPLLITMHSMRKLVKSLIHNVPQVCSMGRTTSKNMVRQRQMIEDDLEALIAKSKEARNQVQVLFHEIDQAHFPRPDLAHR